MFALRKQYDQKVSNRLDSVKNHYVKGRKALKFTNNVHELFSSVLITTVTGRSHTLLFYLYLKHWFN